MPESNPAPAAPTPSAWKDIGIAAFWGLVAAGVTFVLFGFVGSGVSSAPSPRVPFVNYGNLVGNLLAVVFLLGGFGIVLLVISKGAGSSPPAQQTTQTTAPPSTRITSEQQRESTRKYLQKVSNLHALLDTAQVNLYKLFKKRGSLERVRNGLTECEKSLDRFYLWGRSADDTTWGKIIRELQILGGQVQNFKNDMFEDINALPRDATLIGEGREVLLASQELKERGLYFSEDISEVNRVRADLNTFLAEYQKFSRLPQKAALLNQIDSVISEIITATTPTTRTNPPELDTTPIWKNRSKVNSIIKKTQETVKLLDEFKRESKKAQNLTDKMLTRVNELLLKQNPKKTWAHWLGLK